LGRNAPCGDSKQPQHDYVYILHCLASDSELPMTDR
jgi:hypothetical protein